MKFFNSCIAFLEESNIEAVLDLVKKNPELKDYVHKDDALIFHAAQISEEFVKKLIHAGVNINLTDTTGTTALMEYSAEGNIEMVQFLLENGADVKLKNFSGETAFSWACVKNNYECAKMLHSYGANINEEIGIGKSKPLDWALAYASTEFIFWLKSLGAESSETQIHINPG